jgi:protein dispatched 1
MVSIPISLFIYKYILGISYFCSLHIFVVIIIMGIGADDIFVFHDQWQHAKHIRALKKRVPLRLAYSFRKASGAMFVTSVTTAASFLATCFSPIMPICSFGIFSCIVILVNYLLILVALPNIYLFYDRFIQRRFQCLSWAKRNVKNQAGKIKDKSTDIIRKNKHKYDELEEVIIPKNVDLNDEEVGNQNDIVNP